MLPLCYAAPPPPCLFTRYRVMPYFFLWTKIKLEITVSCQSLELGFLLSLALEFCKPKYLKFRNWAFFLQREASIIFELIPFMFMARSPTIQFRLLSNSAWAQVSIEPVSPSPGSLCLYSKNIEGENETTAWLVVSFKFFFHFLHFHFHPKPKKRKPKFYFLQL